MGRIRVRSKCKVTVLGRFHTTEDILPLRIYGTQAETLNLFRSLVAITMVKSTEKSFSSAKRTTVSSSETRRSDF